MNKCYKNAGYNLSCFYCKRMESCIRETIILNNKNPDSILHEIKSIELKKCAEVLQRMEYSKTKGRLFKDVTKVIPTI